MPECNFRHKYVKCLLSEKTVDVEVRVKTMKGIHTFQRDYITHVTSYKPRSTRLCPYLLVAKKINEDLSRIERPNVECPNSNQVVKLPMSSPQKTPGPKKSIDEKKKRSKMPLRRQFKVRLVETLSLPNSAPTTTVQPNSIPLTIHYIPFAKVQKVPSITKPKTQEREATLLPTNNNNPLMKQPTALIPKMATTGATSVMYKPKTDDTPWPNIFLALANLFVTRS